MDRTAIHPRPSSRARAGAGQAIRDLRTWGAAPGRHRPNGFIRTTFSLAHPVAAVTVWVQSSEGVDVLTYRHCTRATPACDWEVTVSDLAAGTYDVIVDVPDPAGGSHTSRSTQVVV